MTAGEKYDDFKESIEDLELSIIEPVHGILVLIAYV